MINDNQLTTIARKQRISFGAIEKDYFITMLLEGISQNKQFKQKWIFKGGTALRKAHFKEYRYSEDLDFTLTKHETSIEIEKGLQKIFDELKEKYGAIYRIKSIHQNKGFTDIKIQFDGLRGGRNTITLDLMTNEIILTQIQNLKIFDEYNNQEFRLKVYSLEEILAEKFRSLLQRTRVRDYYDTWYLLTQTKKQINLDKTKKIFYKKCQYKKIYPAKNLLDEQKIKQAKEYYKKQLENHLKKLPQYEKLIEELKKKLKFLEK